MQLLKKILFVALLSWTALATAGESVNINTADAETLAKILTGVGPKKAAAIIKYREAHGPFQNADQLVEVSGIGKKLIEMNRELITVGDAKAAQ